MNGSVHIFTFKRGLLSRVAHDLRLSVGRYQISVDGDAVTASFEARSLQVDGVMKKGKLDPHALSAKDLREVLTNTHGHVLLSDRHPQLRFAGRAQRSGDILRVSGDLDMVGRRAAVAFPLRIIGQRAAGQVELRPTRWGIAPFKTLMGAIALEDRVVVAFDVVMPEGMVGPRAR